MDLGEKVEENCRRYLGEINEDLEELKGLDVDGAEIFYGKGVFVNGENDEFVEENKDLLEKLTDSYEFFNNKE